MRSLIEYLSGAVTLGYLIAGVFFLKFWRRTADRLFLAFAAAFMLLSLNQVLVAFIGAGDEQVVYAYALRVLGFAVILVAIVDKNFSTRK
jgi:hypothetical protein